MLVATGNRRVKGTRKGGGSGKQKGAGEGVVGVSKGLQRR